MRADEVALHYEQYHTSLILSLHAYYVGAVNVLSLRVLADMTLHATLRT